MNNLKEKAIKGVIWTAMEKWGSQFISFAVFLILARLLKPEIFGLVALANIFFAFMQVFLDQGFSKAIIQRQEIEREHLDTAFWTNISIAVLLLVISLSGAGFIANLFKQPALTPIIRCLSFNFVFAALNSVQSALLYRQLAFKTLTTRTLLATFCGGTIGVAMAFLGFGVWSLVGQQLTNGFVGVLVLWWSTDWKPKFKFCPKHFRELFSFGINVVGIQILDFFNRRSDDLLIGYYLGSVALGYYTVAYRWLLIMTQLLTSVTNQVAMPVFSKLQKEPELLKRAFYTTTQLTSLISFPIFTGMAVLAPEIVRSLFGAKWMPSVPVMQVLAFIGILHSLQYFNGSIIMAMGKPAWKLKLNCLHATANVIAFAIVVRWGILAVASAYVIRGYLLSPIELFIIRKLIPIQMSIYLRQYVAPLIGTVTMAGAILGFKYLFGSYLIPHALLVISTIIGMLTYTVMIIILAPKLAEKIFNSVSLAMPIKLGKITNK